jgi:hypothetical protein
LEKLAMIDRGRSPFADLAARLMSSRASASSVSGNGAGGSLSLALERVAVAEKNLQAAREAARAAARHAGVDLVGLFSEGAFIARATGERWRDEARREGEKVMADIFTRNLDVDAADENSPFQHLAKRLKRHGALQEQQQTPEDLARWHAKMEAAGAFVAMRAGNVEEAARICAELHREGVGKSKGEQILAAGARARMSGDTERPLPPKDSLAAQVIRAGQRRRGEIE